MWIKYQNNPVGRRVGDCSVRAISKALNLSWDDAFDLIAFYAKQMGDVISSDAAWGAVLRENGFTKKTIPNYCPNCFTAEDFCRYFPDGTYVLGFGGHVATVVNGDLYDSWDSSDEIPVYYWRKG